MINKKYLKNLRCKEINNKNEFIVDLFSERIIDSLKIITLDFKNILILGDQETKIIKYIQKRYRDSTLSIYSLNNSNSKYILTID